MTFFCPHFHVLPCSTVGSDQKLEVAASTVLTVRSIQNARSGLYVRTRTTSAVPRSRRKMRISTNCNSILYGVPKLEFRCARPASWCMHFLDPEVEPGCTGKLRRLSRRLSGPNFDLGPHFSVLILSLSTFSFSMHFFAFSDTEI